MVETDKERKAFLGKKVKVWLDRKAHYLAVPGNGPVSTEDVITTGVLLGFGEGGDFEILEDDGFVHYCWPMLDIEEVTG